MHSYLIKEKYYKHLQQESNNVEVKFLTEYDDTPRKYQEGLFSAISGGFFLLLVGILFIITPNLFDNLLNFFGDLQLVDVPNTDVVFLRPEFPRLHLTVYQVVWNSNS